VGRRGIDDVIYYRSTTVFGDARITGVQAEVPGRPSRSRRGHFSETHPGRTEVPRRVDGRVIITQRSVVSPRW
ncbi:hypothetical protein, partial [Candidatus Protofrankia californiensis]|uniref:hypothetical protein n=1 Tax=Candidatus Protofrankia californiensis TaxID=1839754 RepID=UPI0019D099E4